jgi:two-component system, cell cycle response regulator
MDEFVDEGWTSSTEEPMQDRQTDSGGAATSVLVVDDDADARERICRTLSRTGAVCRVASDGEEALAMLERGACDLLVVDYMMPRLNGFDLIRRVRATGKFAGVHAILVTAVEDDDTKVAAFSLGYDAYIPKSVSGDEFSARFEAALRLVRRQKALDSQNRELYDLAIHDELTGIYNRRRLFAAAEEALLRPNALVTLVLFDLDSFKEINDGFGHVVGDQVLSDVGAALAKRTRKNDTVARYGGDEFAMLMIDATKGDIEATIGRICDEVEGLRWTFGTTPVSIGVTTGTSFAVGGTGTSLVTLLATADSDLYRNKIARRKETPQVIRAFPPR